jgi:hypothetical protein
MRKRLFGYYFVFFLPLFCLGLTSNPAFAQAGQSELTGEVHDAAGAGVARATVTVTQTESGDVTTVTTGAGGIYTVTNLRPGTYTVAASAQGFRRLVHENVKLTTGERIRVDAELSVGNIDEEVTVSADASLLRTESSSLGQAIPNRRIVDLPLNGRNFFSLITLSPGVAAPPPTTAGPSLPRLNGGRPRVNEFLYD